jgi:hypothetical protein
MAGISINEHVHWTCDRDADEWAIRDETGRLVTTGVSRRDAVLRAIKIAAAPVTTGKRIPKRIEKTRRPFKSAIRRVATKPKSIKDNSFGSQHDPS